MSQPTRMKLQNLQSRIELRAEDVSYWESLLKTAQPHALASVQTRLADLRAELAALQAALPVVAAKRAARLQKDIDFALAR